MKIAPPVFIADQRVRVFLRVRAASLLAELVHLETSARVVCDFPRGGTGMLNTRSSPTLAERVGKPPLRHC